MSSNTAQSDYDEALKLKEAGNTAFKSGDLKGALKNYSRIFMHIGMNSAAGQQDMAPAQENKSNSTTTTSKKDPLQQKTDELRLAAFNNMAAVYAKMGKWDDCKDKCSKVLKADDKNIKALFRRGMAYRKINLYDLARTDLEKAKKILGHKTDAAIERELKLLNKDEKNSEKEFMAKMKEQMKKAKETKKKRKQEKLEKKRQKQQQEAAKDDNPNLLSNKHLREEDDNDLMFIWDIPQDDKKNNNKNKDNNDEKEKGDGKNKDDDNDKNKQKEQEPKEF